MLKINNQRRRVVLLTIFIVVVACILLSFLFSVKKVRALFDGAHAVYVMYRVESEIMLPSPAGRYYRALFWRNNDELMRIQSNYPENNDVLWDVTVAYIPAMEALVDGKGDTVTISAEQVDALEAELNWLASVSETDLRQDIQREQARFPLQIFAGMTVQEAWDYINANWVAGSPEEEALSEISTSSPPTPDFASTSLDHYTEGNISVDYPAGWSVSSSGSEADQADRTIIFSPPDGSAQSDALRLHVWPLPPGEENSLDPSLSQPAEDGYRVLWQNPLAVGNLRGVRYVWGQPDGKAVLYARLYSQEDQLAIQLSVDIKDPENLKIFGYRYTLGAEYAYFNRVMDSLKVLSLPAVSPTGTVMPTPDLTPTPYGFASSTPDAGRP